MKNSPYILGGEQTDFQRNWVREGKTFVAMLREVMDDALAATQLDMGVISDMARNKRVAVFVGNFAGELYLRQAHLGAFLTEVHPAFFGVPSARYEAACASGAVALDAACTKIRAGDIDLAVVVGIEMMKTVASELGGDYLGTAAYYDKEARGIEYPFPRLFGRLADAILEKYRIDESRFMTALGEIACINYENAKHNPKAQTRKWYMSKEHAVSRGGEENPLIAPRLAVSDASQITDGAVALLLCSPRYAQQYSHSHGTPVDSIPRVKGWGMTTAPMTFDAKLAVAADSQYLLPWTKTAIDDALCRARMPLGEIHFIETHDCFTSSEYAAISCFGITAPGEEHTAIESGIIRRDGKIPVNPSGGLIGCGHPVGASGVRMMLDLWKQTGKRAGVYQVEGARNGAMLSMGGSATTNVAFVVGV